MARKQGLRGAALLSVLLMVGGGAGESRAAEPSATSRAEAVLPDAMALQNSRAEAGPNGPGLRPVTPPAPDRAAPPLRVGARLHTRYRLLEQAPNNAFDVRRARFSLGLNPTAWLETEVELDVAQGAVLKDAWADLRFSRALRLTAGRFKKPFSLIELTSSGRLPLIDRGIANQVLVGELGFGDRDLGLMLHGKLSGLSWSLGAFNGNGGLDEVDRGKDLGGRIETKVLQGLRLGLSGAMKYRNPQGVALPQRASFAAGADGRLRLGPAELVAELLWGQQRTSTRSADALGVTSYATWRVPLTSLLELRPVVFGESVDDDLDHGVSPGWSFGGGANLHAGRIARLMVQARRVRPGGPGPEGWSLALQLAIDESVRLRPPAPAKAAEAASIEEPGG